MDDLAKQLTAEALFGPMEQVLVQECMPAQSFSFGIRLTSSPVAQLCQFHNETPDGLYCVWESTKQFSSRSASFTYGFDAKGLEALKSVLQKKPKARQTPMKRLEALGRFSSNAHKSNKPLTVADAYPARTGKITSETKEQALPTRSRAPHVASKVEYRGPDMDEASRKARRCKDTTPLTSIYHLSDRHCQLVICMKRSMNGAQVLVILPPQTCFWRPDNSPRWENRRVRCPGERVLRHPRVREPLLCYRGDAHWSALVFQSLIVFVGGGHGRWPNCYG